MNAQNRQTEPRRSGRSRRTMYPTAREVLLAKLLLSVLDQLGGTDAFDVDLYNECKHLAEGTVRDGRTPTPLP